MGDLDKLDKTIADWREHGTPGPWGLSRRNPQSSVDGMNDRSICSTGGYQDGTEKAFKENIANAPFIAAAPAMADEIDRLNALVFELATRRDNLAHRLNKFHADLEAVIGEKERCT